MLDDSQESQDNLDQLATSAGALRRVLEHVERKPIPPLDGESLLSAVGHGLVQIYIEQHVALADQALSLRADAIRDGVGKAIIQATRLLLSVRREAEKHELCEHDFTNLAIDESEVRMHCQVIDGTCKALLRLAAKVSIQMRIDGAALYREMHSPSPTNNADADYVLTALEHAIEGSPVLGKGPDLSSSPTPPQGNIAPQELSQTSTTASAKKVRDSLFGACSGGWELAHVVENLERACSHIHDTVEPADFYVASTMITGVELHQPLEDGVWPPTERRPRRDAIRAVLHLRRVVDDALKAVPLVAPLMDGHAESMDRRWTVRTIGHLRKLRGSILKGHDLDVFPSALPMIRSGVPAALRLHADAVAGRMEELKSVMMAGVASQPTSASPSVPAEVVKSAFLTVANYFEGIRRDWIASDSRMTDLIVNGFDTSSNGLAQTMRFEVRGPIRKALDKLRTDADFLPLILPRCDPSLRDAIGNMLRLLDLDSFQNDRYGKNRERWRQTWPAMDMDGHLDELLLKLRAAGDAMTLANTRTIDPAMLAQLAAAMAGLPSLLEKDSAGSEPDVVAKESMVAKDKNAGIGVSDTDWLEVQGRLLVMRDQGKPYTSLRKLCEELGCSDATVRKAIRESDTLKGWQTRNQKPKAAPKATEFSKMAGDTLEQTKEAAPEDVLPDDDVDATMARLIDKAGPDERAKLNALDDAGRRSLVAAYQSQNRDEEPSPLESDTPGQRPRKVQQHKRA